MNVKQALKEKNKLTKLIDQAYQDAAINNSIEEGNTRKYGVKAKLNEAKELTDKLVDLKTRIHRANSIVYDKIFLMAELKGRVNKIRNVPTTEGKSFQGYAATIQTVKSVEVDVVVKDNMIKEVEVQIEKLQDELDTHNTITQI